MIKIWLLGGGRYELKEIIWFFQFGSKNIMTFSLRKELSNYLLEKKIDEIRPEEQLPWQQMH